MISHLGSQASLTFLFKIPRLLKLFHLSTGIESQQLTLKWNKMEKKTEKSQANLQKAGRSRIQKRDEWAFWFSSQSIILWFLLFSLHWLFLDDNHTGNFIEFWRLDVATWTWKNVRNKIYWCLVESGPRDFCRPRAFHALKFGCKSPGAVVFTLGQRYILFSRRLCKFNLKYHNPSKFQSFSEKSKEHPKKFPL